MTNCRRIQGVDAFILKHINSFFLHGKMGLCCPGTLNVVVTLVATACSKYCGPTCHSVGKLVNETCAWCDVELSSDADCSPDEYFDAESVERHADDVRFGCQGQTCLLCNGQELGDLPVNATIYASRSCNKFVTSSDTDDRTHTILLNNTKRLHNGMTIHISKNDILEITGLPLQVLHHFHVINKERAQLQIDTTSHGPESDQCSIVVTSGPSDKRGIVNVNIEPVVIVKGPSRCGLGVFATNDSATNNLHGTVTYNQFKHNETDEFWEAAIAHVEGSLRSNDEGNIILIESRKGSFPVVGVNDLKNVVHLGQLLGLFGTSYEVEYYDENGRLIQPNKLSWIREVNTNLILLTLFLGGVLLSID